jgi:DNA replication protein DnaC
LRPTHRQDLLTLIEERGGKAATVITAQLPVDKWYEYIGEPTVADAIMDRLVNASHRVELLGESMRKLTTSRLSEAAKL